MIQTIQYFLQKSFLWNTIWNYFLFLLFFFILKFSFSFIEKLLDLISHKKQENKVWQFINIIFENINDYVYILISLFLPMQILNIQPELDQIIKIIFWIFISIEIIWLIYRVIVYVLFELYFDKKNKNIDDSTKNMISIMIKIIVWIMWILLVLVNSGIQITPLLAWLGVWGIAIWFALQNILSDIFASFSIFLDKPYKIWDYIVIWTDSGTVIEITIKSTRLICNGGQTIVIPNKEIASKIIHNYSKIKKRRKTIFLNLSYENNEKQIKKFLTDIKVNLNKIDNINFLRSIFKDYGDFYIILEIVYENLEVVYEDSISKNEEINNKIFALIKKHNIEIYKLMQNRL